MAAVLKVIGILVVQQVLEQLIQVLVEVAQVAKLLAITYQAQVVQV